LILLLLCVLIPCITVFALTNVIMFREYRESVSASQLNRLKAIDNTNQMLIDNIEQSASRFSLDPNVQSLVDFTTLRQISGDSRYLTGLRRSMAMLGEFVSTNELFDSAYLYIDGSDYIISSRDSVVPLDRFSDHTWIATYEALKADRDAGRLIPAHIVKSGYQTSGNNFTLYNQACLTYVYPITPYISNFHGALVFNIYEDKLLRMYAQPNANSSLTIFTRNVTPLTGISSRDEAPGLNPDDLQRIFAKQSQPSGSQPRVPDDQTYFFSGSGKGQYQLTYHHSEETGLVLVSLDDMGALMEKATSFQLVFVLFLLFFIPFVALLIYWGSRRLYSPIRLLARELCDSGRLELAGETKDEWPAISRAINELLREDRKLFSDSEREKLKEATCLRILAGEEEEEDVQRILPHPRNLCVLAWLTAPAQGPDADNTESRIRLLLWLMEDALTEPGIQATAIRYEGSAIVLLLSIDEQQEPFQPQLPEPTWEQLQRHLRTKLAMIQEETQKVMQQTITFAVSSLQEDHASIREALNQARVTMQYRFMKGLRSILFHDDILLRLDYYQADERLHFISHCLYAGKKEELLQGVCDLVDDIKNKGNVSYTYTSQILNQLVSMLAQYTMENDISLDELLGSSTIIYQRLWQNATLDDAGAWFCDLAARVMDHGNASDKKSEYIKSILSYVQENYQQGITIDSIADHIGLSYSYLRKLFKEATGQNLSDHLNNLRMQKAKQLLRETNFAVKDIVSQCGYSNARSFLRTFTQAEGVSPTKYREQQAGGV
jgi:YesN/AraC family two-component response regulator